MSPHQGKQRKLQGTIQQKDQLLTRSWVMTLSSDVFSRMSERSWCDRPIPLLWYTQHTVCGSHKYTQHAVVVHTNTNTPNSSIDHTITPSTDTLNYPQRKNSVHFSTEIHPNTQRQAPIPLLLTHQTSHLSNYLSSLPHSLINGKQI